MRGATRLVATLVLGIGGMHATAGAQPAAPTGSSAAAVGASCEAIDPSCHPPSVAREFRGVWVASVANIDWPSKPGLSRGQAQAELRAMLDRAKSSGLNAVIFQVRPAGDALYESKLEPWSEYLTGQQGRAPSPWWDPLAFAVSEAHARGLELHAWFNPYRARHPSAKGGLSATHLANTRPALVKRYGTHRWMDPGEDAVREHTVKVVLDVVRRYDIDGVHLDDYFYPYKERDRAGQTIPFPDSSSYARYVTAGGTLARDDWRRENVDRLVKELHDGIHAVKPWVKFGVSPFGIWRPGFPWQIRGFDAHNELYADARKWLREGWVDYFSPQLYWTVGSIPQSYPVLLRWWSQQNMFGRHIWPGNFTSKVGEASRTAWTTPEIERQVAATRGEPGATGNVHFSAKVFMQDRDSLATRLGRGAYAERALVPPSPWLAVEPHDAPAATLERARNGAVTLRVVPSTGSSPRWWLVQSRGADGAWTSALVRGALRSVPVAATADRVAVRAVDHAALESPATVMKVQARR